MRNRSENQIEVYLIRHGATNANREHRYLGRTEEPLSEEGREELKAFQRQGIYPDPASLQALFVSPMERCRETAELLFGDCEQHVIPEFREMDFGLFEGKNYQDLQGDARYQTWIDSNGTIPFPEGESREDFIARCRQGFEEMLRIAIAGVIGRNEEDKNAEDKNAAKQKTMDENLRIAAVVHGGTIMAVCSSFTDGEYFDFQIGNGEGYRCKVTVGQSSGEIYMDKLCKLVM
jgi:alpha-ribazole phosphatase